MGSEDKPGFIHVKEVLWCVCIELFFVEINLPAGHCLVPACDLSGSLSVHVNSLFSLHSDVSGSGACHPHFSTLLSKPLVMAYLAPAVAACAHSRPPAQSLSCPIYLTQTRAFQPCPAYLSAGWLSFGLSTNLKPLPPGNQKASRRGSAECFVAVCMSLACVHMGILQDSHMDIKFNFTKTLCSIETNKNKLIYWFMILQ